MGINDLEILKQACENLRNGKVAQDISSMFSDPTTIYNVTIGLVILGMYVGMGVFFGKGLKKICDEDERIRGEQLYSNPPEFVVTNIGSAEDKDPTDKRKVHKFVANGYLD